MENKINYEVIDRFFAAQMSANECEATLAALRPQVEEAVEALIREQGMPRNFTGTIPYNGFKIRTPGNRTTSSMMPTSTTTRSSTRCTCN